MSGWQIKVPGHPNTRLDAKSIFNLTDALGDPEDKAVARELLTYCYTSGVRRVGEITRGLDQLPAWRRRRVLNGLRQRAGLPLTKTVEDRREYEAANQAGAVRSSGFSAWQACPACGSVPVDPYTGIPAPVDVRRWWCEAHRDQASPGDMSAHGSGVRISESGALVPIDEGELAREEAEAEARRHKLEASIAQREREAESTRLHQEAREAEIRRLLPPGIPG
jgi:hypothetical protein